MIKKIILFLKISLVVFFCILLLALLINIFIVQYAKKHIIARGEYSQDTVDCVIVLGASAKTGKPSLMLQDRLDLAYELYNQGYVNKILVSGDHMYESYDEANVMKDYLLSLGVPEEDIFMDHAGINTYASMKRAKEVFMVDSCIVSTQKYHLYRAVYIARQMGIEAKGIACDVYISSKLPYFKTREFFARFKDFFYVNIFNPDVILGEEIPITGDGRMTEDGLT